MDFTRWQPKSPCKENLLSPKGCKRKSGEHPSSSCWGSSISPPSPSSHARGHQYAKPCEIVDCLQWDLRARSNSLHEAYAAVDLLLAALKAIPRPGDQPFTASPSSSRTSRQSPGRRGTCPKENVVDGGGRGHGRSNVNTHMEGQKEIWGRRSWRLRTGIIYRIHWNSPRLRARKDAFDIAVEGTPMRIKSRHQTLQ